MMRKYGTRLGIVLYNPIYKSENLIIDKKTYLYCGTVRLSEFNAYGKTNIKITLINNLRNLLGPHHLKRGESIRVTPGDFYKEKCIWDMNTEDKWDDSYCFTMTGVKLDK